MTSQITNYVRMSRVFILSQARHHHPQLLTLLHLPGQPVLDVGPPPVVLHHVLQLGVNHGQLDPEVSLGDLSLLSPHVPVSQSGEVWKDGK